MAAASWLPLRALLSHSAILLPGWGWSSLYQRRLSVMGKPRFFIWQVSAVATPMPHCSALKSYSTAAMENSSRMGNVFNDK